MVTPSHFSLLFPRHPLLPLAAHPPVEVPKTPNLTPWGALSGQLIRAGIITDEGVIVREVVAKHPLPPLNEAETATLHNTICENRSVTVNVRDNQSVEVVYSLHDFFIFLDSHHVQLTSLELIGGAVPSLIPSYYFRCLEELYKAVTKEELNIPTEVKEDFARQPADINIRCHIAPHIPPSEVENFGKLIPLFLVAQICKTDPTMNVEQLVEEVAACGTVDLKTFFGTSIFCLAGLRGERHTVTIQFAKTLGLPHLFTQHGLPVRIESNDCFVLNNHEQAFQAIVDRTCKVIRHENISLAGASEWPMLMYYRAIGYTCCSTEYAGVFYNKMRSLSSKTVAQELYNAWSKHDRNPRTLVAMTLQGALALKDKKSAGELWDDMLAIVKKDSGKFHDVVIELVSGSPTMQIAPPSALPVALVILKERAEKLMAAGGDSAEFLLGYHLMLTCHYLSPHSGLNRHLLLQMPQALACAPTPEARLNILKAGEQVLRIPARTVAQMEGGLKSAETAQQISLSWIKALADSGDERACHLAWELFEANKSAQSPLTEGIKLIESYRHLPVAIAHLLKLQKQSPSKIEGEEALLKSISDAYSRQENRTTAQANIPNICEAAHNLAKRSSTKKKGFNVTTVATLSAVVDFLVKQEAFKEAHALLMLLGNDSKESLVREIPRLVEMAEEALNRGNPIDAWAFWQSAEKIEGWQTAIKKHKERKDPFLLALCKAFYQSNDPALSLLGDQVFELIRKENITDSQLLNLLSRRILNIVKGDQKVLAESLMASRAVKNMTAQQLFPIRLQLANQHLKSKRIEEAYTVLMEIFNVDYLPEDRSQLERRVVTLLATVSSLPRGSVAEEERYLKETERCILLLARLPNTVRIDYTIAACASGILISFLKKHGNALSKEMRSTVTTCLEPLFDVLRSGFNTQNNLIQLVAVLIEGSRGWDEHLSKMTNTHSHLEFCAYEFVVIKQFLIASSLFNIVTTSDHKCSDKIIERWGAAIEQAAVTEDPLAVLPHLANFQRYALSGGVSRENSHRVVSAALSKDLTTAQLEMVLDVCDRYLCLDDNVWLRLLTLIERKGNKQLKLKAHAIFKVRSNDLPQTSARAECWVSLIGALVSVSSPLLIEMFHDIPTFLKKFDYEGGHPHLATAFYRLLNGSLPFLQNPENSQEQQTELFRAIMLALPLIYEQLLNRGKNSGEPVTRLAQIEHDFQTHSFRALRAALKSPSRTINAMAMEGFVSFIETIASFTNPEDVAATVRECSALAVSRFDTMPQLNVAVLNILNALNPHSLVFTSSAVKLDRALPAFRIERLELFMKHAAKASLPQIWEDALRYFIENSCYIADDNNKLLATARQAMEFLYILSTDPNTEFNGQDEYLAALLNSVNLLDANGRPLKSLLSDEVSNQESYDAIYNKSRLLPILEVFLTRYLKTTFEKRVTQDKFLILASKVYGILLQDYVANKGKNGNEGKAGRLASIFPRIFYGAPPKAFKKRISLLVNLFKLVRTADAATILKSEDFHLCPVYLNMAAAFTHDWNDRNNGKYRLFEIHRLLDIVIPQRNTYSLFLLLRFLEKTNRESENGSASEVGKAIGKLLEAALDTPIAEYGDLVTLTQPTTDLETSSAAASGEIEADSTSRHGLKYVAAKPVPLAVDAHRPAFFAIAEAILSNPHMRDAQTHLKTPSTKQEWKTTASLLFHRFYHGFMDYYKGCTTEFQASFPRCDFVHEMHVLLIRAIQEGFYLYNNDLYLFVLTRHADLLLNEYEKNPSVELGKKIVELFDTALEQKRRGNHDLQKDLVNLWINRMLDINVGPFPKMLFKAMPRLFVGCYGDSPRDFWPLYKRVTEQALAHLKANKEMSSEEMRSIAIDIVKLIYVSPASIPNLPRTKAQLASRWIIALDKLDIPKCHEVATAVYQECEPAVFGNCPEEKKQLIGFVQGLIDAIKRQIEEISSGASEAVNTVNQ